MPRFPLVFGCLGALALGSVGAARLAADEPPAPPPAAPQGPTPQERAAQVFARLAPPKAGEKWSFDGEVVINGLRRGSALLVLEAAQEGEALLWKATETVRIGLAEKPVVSIDLEAFVDAALTGLHGTTSSVNAQGKTTVTWRRTPMGYGFERQVEGKDPEKALAGEATVLKASLGGMVRFCAALPAEPAVYAVQVLNQEANVGPLPENRAKDVTLTVEGEKEIHLGPRTGKAWVVALKDKDGERSLAFDLKDRSLLAIEKPASSLVIRRRGLVPAPKAATAEEAALLAGRAFALADLETIRDVTWWPAATEKLKDQPGFADLDVAGRRAKVLEALSGSLRAQASADLIDMGLEMAKSSLVVEDAEGGRKRVRFPETFRSLEFLVMEVEGAWYLAEFPAKPSSGPPK